MVQQFGLLVLPAAGLTCFEAGQPTSHIVKVRGIKTTKNLKAGAHACILVTHFAPILVVRSWAFAHLLQHVCVSLNVLQEKPSPEFQNGRAICS